MKYEDLTPGMEIETLACTGKWQAATIVEVIDIRHASGKNRREAKAQWLGWPQRWTVIQPNDDMSKIRLRQADQTDRIAQLEQQVKQLEESRAVCMQDRQRAYDNMEAANRNLGDAQLAKMKAEQACQRIAKERDEALGRAEAAEEDVEKRDAQLAEVAMSMADINRDLRAQLISQHHKERLREMRASINQCSRAENCKHIGDGVEIVTVKRSWLHECRELIDEILLSIAGRE